jgi:2-polyprenyl-6-methoxyphenol hydroxylase-like FAD-dependent oxidoreductase
MRAGRAVSAPVVAPVVVVGGGCAGALVALRLAAQGVPVRLVERRAGLLGEAAAGGAPQRHHVHLLNAQGRAHLVQRWPAVAAALADAGDVHAVDVDAGVLWLGPSGARLGPQSTHVGELWFFHRRVLDRVLAAAVRDSGVDVVCDARVDGVCDHGVVVDGVRVDARAVVWATGRFDAGPWRFLASPPRRHVMSRLVYRSCEVHADPSVVDAAARVLLVSSLGPLRPRGFVCVPIGAHGRHLITQVVVPARGAVVDGSAAAFVDHFAGFGLDAVSAFAATVRPLGAPRVFHLGGSTRLSRGALSRLPRGHFVVGDQLATLNPVFGQGVGFAVDVAARVAAAVVEDVDRAVVDDALAAVVDDAFATATVEDRLAGAAAVPGVAPLVRAGMAAFFSVMRHSDGLHRAFVRRANGLPLW